MMLKSYACMVIKLSNYVIRFSVSSIVFHIIQQWGKYSIIMDLIGLSEFLRWILFGDYWGLFPVLLVVWIISLFEIQGYEGDLNDCYLIQKIAWIQWKGKSWNKKNISFIYWKFMVQFILLEIQIKRMDYKERG